MKYYRNDLLKKYFDAKGLSLDAVYKKTGIAINTQRAALAGRNLQIDKLKAFADFCGVQWLLLFDLNKTIPTGDNLPADK